MEFWATEVKSGETIKVEPGQKWCLHLTQANLGEVNKGKSTESVHLFVNVDGKKLVLGTLISENLPNLQFDLAFDRDFELSHSWKDGSVYFFGYKMDTVDDYSEDDMGDDSDSSSEDDDIPLGLDNSVKSETKVKEEKPADKKVSMEAANGVPKGTDDDSSDDDSEEEMDDDSDSSSEDVDIPLGLENSVKSKTKVKEEKPADKKVSMETANGVPKGSDDDSSDDDSETDEESSGSDVNEDESDSEGSEDDSEDDSEEDEDESEEDEPAKVESGKKRASDSEPKTPASKKKVKLTTPEKTDGKKGSGVHVDTPHPSKKTAKSSGGGSHVCKSCTRSFGTESSLDSHTKAKHGSGK